jgi:hypothetical protein
MALPMAGNLPGSSALPTLLSASYTHPAIHSINPRVFQAACFFKSRTPALKFWQHVAICRNAG